MSEQYCNQAIVKKITSSAVYVEMTIHSACSGCHAKTVCLASERKQETFPVEVANPAQFEIGETISIQMHKSVGHQAVLMAYVYPVVVLMTFLLSVYAITSNELLSIGAAFAATAIYFIILKLSQKKIEEKITFTISKIEA